MNQIPAALAHLKPDESTLSEGLMESGMNLLTYRGKEWRLRYDQKLYDIESRTVDLIIARAAPYTSRVFFPKWDNRTDGTGVTPLCFSLKGDVPDPSAPMPQNPTCSGCQRDAWIFKEGGNRGKECQANRRLAVLLHPKLTARLLGKPLLELVFFRIPPGSFQALIQFDRMLQNRGLRPEHIMTRVGFDPAKQFAFSFSDVKVLDNEEAKIIARLREEDDALRITGERQEPAQITASNAIEDDYDGDTGLVEAFSADSRPIVPALPVKRGPGRPRKVDPAPVPEPVEKAQPTLDASSKRVEDLPDVLSRKVADMLK